MQRREEDSPGEARTLQQAESLELRVAALDTFADVDTEEDWNQARDEFFPESAQL